MAEPWFLLVLVAEPKAILVADLLFGLLLLLLVERDGEVRVVVINEFVELANQGWIGGPDVVPGRLVEHLLGGRQHDEDLREWRWGGGAGLRQFPLRTRACRRE